MVANKFLEEVDMAHDVRKECVFMCKYFHESVRELSDRSVCHQLISLARSKEGPFLESPGNFSGPKPIAKSRTLRLNSCFFTYS